MSLANAGFAVPDEHAGARWQVRLGEARALVRLTVPIMLIALVNMGMSLTDTAMVAAFFGTGALAAVAVGSDLYSIVFYLGAGVLGGIAPFYAATVARADAAERARLERIGWLTAGLVALVAVPTVWLAPAWLAPLGLDPALLAEGAGYTRAMALTLVPMLGVMLYRTLLTAAERPRVFLKVTLAMLPLNAGANYVLMLGAGPLPAYGPAGAGLGSFVVAVASLGLLAAVARRDTLAAPPAPVDWHSLAVVLRVGLPIGIATVAEVGVFLGATLYAATLGAADVAAHTLTLRTAGVAYAAPAALLQASLVRMARAEGLGDAAAARAVVASSLLLSLLIGTVICLLLVGGAGPLATAFFDASPAGRAAAGIALGLLVLLGLVEFVGNPGLAAAGLLRGRKDTRAPMIYVLVGHWIVGAPLGIALCEFGDLGVIGIWIGLAAGTLATTAMTLFRLAGAWRDGLGGSPAPIR
jgi:multidrug resistance protein, MATE family